MLYRFFWFGYDTFDVFGKIVTIFFCSNECFKSGLDMNQTKTLLRKGLGKYPPMFSKYQDIEWLLEYLSK